MVLCKSAYIQLSVCCYFGFELVVGAVVASVYSAFGLLLLLF